MIPPYHTETNRYFVKEKKKSESDEIEYFKLYIINKEILFNLINSKKKL